MVGGSSSKRAPDESFFDYEDTKGWHRSHGHRRPPDSGLRHGLSQRNPLQRGLSQRSRKISKEDITYPFLPPQDTLDLQVESATMSAEREREQRLRRQNSTTTTSTQSDRPPRPSLEERPLVVRDPKLRMEEQKVYKNVNTAKRPERPREEDLPYGAAGSIPRVFVKDERPPPPAAAVRGAGSRMQSLTRSNTVPFPSNKNIATRGEDSVRGSRATEATRTTERTALRPPVQTPASAKFFTPFAHISPRERPSQNTSSTQPVDARSAGSSYLAQANTSPQRLLEPEHAPTPPPKDSKWVGANAQTPGRYIRRQDGVRRVSSSGDVHLPPQHSRYHPRDENESRDPRAPARPELRTVKSTPLSARKQNVPVHPAAPSPGLPAHPAVHLERVGTRTRKPRHPDVPRDVSPDNPQRLPTPRRSEEGERPAPRAVPRPREREQVREKEREAASYETQAAARVEEVPKSPAASRHPVPTAHDHVRSVSYRAQVVHPSQRDRRDDPPPENDDRQKRRREKEEKGRSVEWYGMGIAWEIARALADPEDVTPTPIDWDQFSADGEDYGTKPLRTRRRRETTDEWSSRS